MTIDMTVTTPEDSPNIDEVDVDTAVTATGFGKFNIKTAIFGGLIYLNTGLSIGSVGFILPSAACDLQLSTLDKGRISSAPILGMAVGSYFWGCFGDLYGRKITLFYALFAYAIIEIMSSVVKTYWLFLLLKFFSGWVITGQTAIGFTFLGEFQSNLFREKIMCWMEFAWTIGIISSPLIGWLIIPLEFAYVTDKFSFRSWNLFIIVCALPSIIVGFWLVTFPETPKYLAENKQDDKLANALEIMYNQNTGGTFDDYLDNLTKNGHDRLRTRLSLAREITDQEKISANEKLPIISIFGKGRLFLKMLRSIVVQSIELWKPPILKNTLISCCLFYCVGSSYYALVLWFPELFQRFANFEKIRPDDSASVCTISSGNWTVMDDSENSMDECPSIVDTNVYLHTLILGLACFPGSIVLPLFVAKFGYKFFLIVSTAIASLVTIGLFFVRSSTQNLILSCIFEASCSVSVCIIMCIAFDLFPTNLRAMAASLALFFGRIGALISNLLVGYLIDDHCISLILIIAAQLILSTIVGFLLPGKSKIPGS